MIPLAYEADFTKTICETCGAQYSEDISSPPGECKICLDPRQWVPPTGQKWTSIRQILGNNVKTNFEPSEFDERVIRLNNDPPVGIAQTRMWRSSLSARKLISSIIAILLSTPEGIVIWDSSGFISPDAIEEIRKRFTSGTPFLGIAISHPHFYNSSVTIFRALTDALDSKLVAPSARIFVHAVDREWWVRTDALGLEHVDFWEGDTKQIAKGVTIVKCGGEPRAGLHRVLN